LGQYRAVGHVYSVRRVRCFAVIRTISAAQEPAWSAIEGGYTISGNAVFVTEGQKTNPPLNRNWTVVSVPTATTFVVRSDSRYAYADTAGYVASLDKTYLSQYAPAAARTATSRPLTGKTVLPGPVLDCDDFSLDLTGQDSSEVVLLVKTAALHADADLADTAQRIIAHYDTLPSLPFVANAGVVSLPVPNTADRLMRL
jgi:hypothetical protein